MFQHVHTCQMWMLIQMLLQNGTNAGDRLSTNDRNNLQGIEITNDGQKYL